jgi:hypothetical protein
MAYAQKPILELIFIPASVATFPSFTLFAENEGIKA